MKKSLILASLASLIALEVNSMTREQRIAAARAATAKAAAGSSTASVPTTGGSAGTSSAPMTTAAQVVAADAAGAQKACLQILQSMENLPGAGNTTDAIAFINRG